MGCFRANKEKGDIQDCLEFEVKSDFQAGPEKTDLWEKEEKE